MATVPPLELAPWSLVAPHLAHPYAFLLDRGRGKSSFAGSDPVAQLVVEHDGRVREFRGGHWVVRDVDPVDAISRFVEVSEAAPAPETSGGAHVGSDAPWLPRTVGYLAYELGRFTEPASARTTQDVRDVLRTPLAVLSTYDSIDVWNPRRTAVTRLRFGDASGNRVTGRLDLDSGGWTQTSHESYRRGFDTIKRAISAGDIYQANLSRRILAESDDEPAVLYSRLRRAQPVPHGAYLDCGEFQLLSNSPETFLSRNGDRVLTRPIKGTRARGLHRSVDRRLRRDLVADPKENAEHLMIVDLERNDLGRIARTGSVEVTRFAEVESFATVHHLVSDVEATLHDGIDVAAVLRATFPGGSITGAPKIRAMELLAEVEESRRGPYCGAIGFFNGCRSFELSIAIRTAVTCRGRAAYSAGGGIVADSDCEREWEETEIKAAAFRACLGRADTPLAAAGS